MIVEFGQVVAAGNGRVGHGRAHGIDGADEDALRVLGLEKLTAGEAVEGRFQGRGQPFQVLAGKKGEILAQPAEQPAQFRHPLGVHGDEVPEHEFLLGRLEQGVGLLEKGGLHLRLHGGGAGLLLGGRRPGMHGAQDGSGQFARGGGQPGVVLFGEHCRQGLFHEGDGLGEQADVGRGQLDDARAGQVEQVLHGLGRGRQVGELQRGAGLLDGLEQPVTEFRCPGQDVAPVGLAHQRRDHRFRLAHHGQAFLHEFGLSSALFPGLPHHCLPVELPVPDRSATAAARIAPVLPKT